MRIGRYLTPPQRNHAIDVAEPEGEYKQDDTKKKFPEDKKFGYFQRYLSGLQRKRVSETLKEKKKVFQQI